MKINRRTFKLPRARRIIQSYLNDSERAEIASRSAGATYCEVCSWFQGDRKVSIDLVSRLGCAAGCDPVALAVAICADLDKRGDRNWSSVASFYEELRAKAEAFDEACS